MPWEIRGRQSGPATLTNVLVRAEPALEQAQFDPLAFDSVSLFEGLVGNLPNESSRTSRAHCGFGLEWHSL